MNMAEPAERALNLFVYEVIGDPHFGDPARHLKREAEMPSSPSDFFTQGDQAGRHTIYGLFTRFRHGILVGVDASGKVEQLGFRDLRPRCALKEDGHHQSIAAVIASA